MNKEVLTNVANCIVDILPEKWEDILLRSNISSGYYNMYFYVKVNNKYLYCFDLPKKYNVSISEINKAFAQINDYCKESQKEKKWTSFTFRLTAEGKFTIDYEYKDPIDKDQWKIKYLIG